MIRKIKKRQRPQRTVQEYVEGILRQNRVILSQAITLIESTKLTHQALAQQIIQQCLPYSGNSIRIGITGTPGVGKSTFIEAIGQHLTQQDRKLAVLAIDPTSQLSKGSILGDKTRMQELSINQNAFIRPSPAGTTLGGVAQKTRETIILCEAAGFDTIIVETVGVGQSEIAVNSMTDFFLLLLLPGSGDELQGIKRGIVEMADLVAFNKADGENLQKAKLSKRAYRNALHLYPVKASNWTPKAMTCSALSKTGIVEIWELILKYQQFTVENDYFNQNRQQQAKFWLHETIKNRLHQLFYENPSIKKELTTIEQQILNEELSPFQGADLLMKMMKGL